MNKLKTPWLQSYDDVPFNLKYPKVTISEQILKVAKKYPLNKAYVFQGKTTNYKDFVKEIYNVAYSYKSIGIKANDKVLICMPNCPQAIVSLYALNLLGCISVMVHPLSAEGELEYFIKLSKANTVLTLHQLYWKFKNIRNRSTIDKIIVASIEDALGTVKKFGYKIVNKKNKVKKIPSETNTFIWREFYQNFEGSKKSIVEKKLATDPAIILFSGGTTGTTKGILLSNYNLNALALQTATMCNNPVVGKSMLAAMPIFHGFGLGCCIHSMLASGGTSILVPRFNVESYAKLIKKEKPNYIAGVPSLYEAVTRSKVMENIDLSFLLGVFSGGDSLSIELKKKIDSFLKTHGASIRVREGYGTTECVTASCLTPFHKEKEGSIGLPYPDTYYKICKVGTKEELPFNKEGEICLTGPTIMLGYYNNLEETQIALKKHSDGHTWLHTGDLGYMDEEGYIFFKQRIKRMIITNGYNVYPSQIENIIEKHEAVQLSCVIGVKDPIKMQKVKAFVVLKPNFKPSDELRNSIFNHCKKNIAKYMLPYRIEFRDELPKTRVGKIAYTELEKEDNQ